MPSTPHEMATEHLPAFIVGPGDTDVLFAIVFIFLLVTVLLVGVFYFKLHSLPEQMAHDINAGQIQIIGILSLLALFTHNNYFWIAALLLAAVKVPDFLTPLTSIANSLEQQTKEGK